MVGDDPGLVRAPIEARPAICHVDHLYADEGRGAEGEDGCFRLG